MSYKDLPLGVDHVVANSFSSPEDIDVAWGKMFPCPANSDLESNMEKQFYSSFFTRIFEHANASETIKSTIWNSSAALSHIAFGNVVNPNVLVDQLIANPGSPIWNRRNGLVNNENLSTESIVKLFDSEIEYTKTHPMAESTMLFAGIGRHKNAPAEIINQLVDITGSRLVADVVVHSPKASSELLRSIYESKVCEDANSSFHVDIAVNKKTPEDILHELAGLTTHPKYTTILRGLVVNPATPYSALQLLLANLTNASLAAKLVNRPEWIGKDLYEATNALDGEVATSAQKAIMNGDKWESVCDYIYETEPKLKEFPAAWIPRVIGWADEQ